MIKRLPKNSLSPQQADGVFSRIFSLRDQQSLIVKNKVLERHQDFSILRFQIGAASCGVLNPI